MIARKPIALHLALGGSIALLALSAITFYLRSDAPKVEPVSAPSAGPPAAQTRAEPPASAAPAAAVAPTRKPNKITSDDVSVFKASSEAGDAALSPAQRGTHSHRTRPARAKAAAKAIETDGATKPSDSLEHGALVDPF